MRNFTVAGPNGYEPCVATSSVVGLSPTNACGCVFKCVSSKYSTVMLTAVQSAGVTPEVNLRIPLHTDEKACKQWIQPGFETQVRHHQESKRGVSVAPKKN